MDKKSASLRNKAVADYKKALGEEHKAVVLWGKGETKEWQVQQYKAEQAEHESINSAQAYKSYLYQVHGWSVPVDLTVPKQVVKTVTKAVKR